MREQHRLPPGAKVEIPIPEKAREKYYEEKERERAKSRAASRAQANRKSADERGTTAAVSRRGNH